jgi:cAMP-dependent protein kinase regulator
MGDKLEKLKNEASAFLKAGKNDKALAVFEEILKEDPQDVGAALKAGDLSRQAGNNAAAIARYNKVAHIYAEDGLLLKAIAACKTILEIDPAHTDTQQMLADLYAKRTGRSAPAAPPPLPKPAEGPIEVGADDIIVEEAPEQLPTIPLFSDLSKNAFIQLMTQMKMRHVQANDAIIREGETDDKMFILSSGKVKVTRTSDTGAEVVLAYLEDGAFFGEMALLSEAPRSASVIAVGESDLFEISRDVLDDVIKNFPSVKGTMLRFYRQRLLANLLGTSPIFKPLDANQRKGLIEQFKSREMGANEKIIEEGQAGDGLYMLLSGRAEVSKKIDNKKAVLAHLKEGDVFGEISLLKNQPVGATIRTLRKAIVLKLPKKTFNEVVAAHPQLLQHVSELANERERTTKAIAEGKMKFSEEGLVVV